MKKINWGKLISSLLLVFLAGGIGSAFTTPSINSWYRFLNKPFFSPPNWLFGPVWTILYIMIAVSFYLVWLAKSSPQKSRAVKYFFIQLVLNSLWSIIFFGMKNPWLAFGEILILWLMILLTIKAFMSLNKKAGWLLFPYLLWVSFASLLNFSVAYLN